MHGQTKIKLTIAPKRRTGISWTRELEEANEVQNH